MEHLACRKPSPLHRPQRHAEHVGGCLLGKPLVVEERDHLLLPIRKSIAGLVKRRPGGEILRLPVAVEGTAGLIGGPMVGVVVGGQALRTVVVAFEVDELPTDLRAGEIEEVARRLHLHLAQGPVEPHQCVLSDIVGRLPASHLRILPQHPSRESQQPLVGVLQEHLAGSVRTLPHGSDQPLKLRIGFCVSDVPTSHARSVSRGILLPGYPAAAARHICFW